MRCLRLPFGYVDSPRTTEEEAYGPVAVELLRDDRPKSKAADGCIGVLVDSKGSYHKSGGPHQPLGTEFFVVTHLIERIEVPASLLGAELGSGDGLLLFQHGGRGERDPRLYLARLEDRVDTLQTRPAPYPASDSSGPISVTELTQSGIETIDEHGELHMSLVASDAGGVWPGP